MEYLPEGVIYATAGVSGQMLPPEADAFVGQLEDVGLMDEHETGGRLLSWDNVYRVLTDDELDLSPGRAVLPLPPVDPDIVPSLSHVGVVWDPTFRVQVDGWNRRGSGRLADRLEGQVGPVVPGHPGVPPFMLSAEVWQLIGEIRALATLALNERTEEANKLHLGRIRQLAIDAGAGLDDYLTRTIVVTPKSLGLKLERTVVDENIQVEVVPVIAGTPEEFLQCFDRAAESAVYKVVSEKDEALYEVIVDGAVRAALAAIKSTPNRRVAGARAQKLISNPIAYFGEEAAEAFNEQALEDELSEVRRDAWEFRPSIILSDDHTIDSVAVECTSLGDAGAPTRAVAITTVDGLRAFRRRVGEALEGGHAFCAWHGMHLVVDGNAASTIEELDRAIEAWGSGIAVEPVIGVAGNEAAAADPSRVLIDASMVFDLSHYYDRVEGIGVETPYGIATIPLTEKGAWLPDGSAMTVSGDDDNPLAGAKLTRDDLNQLRDDVLSAEKGSGPTIDVPGVGEVPIEDARAFIDSLPARIWEDIDSDTGAATPEPAGADRVGLLIGPNIDEVDYARARTDALVPPDGSVALVPESLRDGIELKDHQVDGLRVLQHLFSQAPDPCGGVLLADDMGLGKTLQTLALIMRAREMNPDLAPALVVAPVSLLANWAAEVDKFLVPGALTVSTLWGERLREYRVPKNQIAEDVKASGVSQLLRPGWEEGAGLVLTTYKTLRDYEFSFGSVDWSFVVCDEAQNIKNPNAMVTRAAKKLKAEFCLAVTGTPVENNLADLWSLFDFVQPGLLEPLNKFNKTYRRPIEAKTEDEAARTQHLAKLIWPQTLRRTKEEVAKDLPAKIFDQRCLQIPMSDLQRVRYQDAIDQYKMVAGSDRGAMLRLISQLRVLSADPRSPDERDAPLPPLAQYRETSPKLGWLMDTLHEIRARGEKALVFMESKAVQALVQHYIREEFGFAPQIINGDTPAGDADERGRQRRIDRFQETDGFSVLILSPVAAGVGLNIQAANHVIHYMRHWNPAKEDQATDRAYRIGQTRPVTVYTPTVVGDGWVSFEERLDELLGSKRRIATDMLNGADSLSESDFEDLVA